MSAAVGGPRQRPGAANRPTSPIVLSRLPLRLRLTLALVAAALLPLLILGLLVFLASQLAGTPVDETVGRLLVLALAAGIVIAVFLALALAADLTAPLRAIAAAVERVAGGDLTTPIAVNGDDEIAHLARSHNRLAADVERRNRQLEEILAALASLSPHDPPEWIVGRAVAQARTAFGLLDADVILGDPATVPPAETIPGEARPVRAVLQAGGEPVGILVGRLPATATWDPADQNLLALFAGLVAVALRNAQLFARVESQNARLRELDAAKDDFLRGVSHNLQTPLARIRAYAEQVAAERPDPRLTIVAEQAERLSRMVRQLVTVSRLDSGALRPRQEVVALAPRVRRTWEALAAGTVPFLLQDEAPGWLAVADPDGIDQVLWALLDNAVKYGAGSRVTVTIRAQEELNRLVVTVGDEGPGIPEADRGRLFGRFQRGSGVGSDAGSGLGLYVSRALCRAMGGDLVLEPSKPGTSGAVFAVYLPGERAGES